MFSHQDRDRERKERGEEDGNEGVEMKSKSRSQPSGLNRVKNLSRKLSAKSRWVGNGLGFQKLWKGSLKIKMNESNETRWCIVLGRGTGENMGKEREDTQTLDPTGHHGKWSVCALNSERADDTPRTVRVCNVVVVCCHWFYPFTRVVPSRKRRAFSEKRDGKGTFLRFIPSPLFCCFLPSMLLLSAMKSCWCRVRRRLPASVGIARVSDWERESLFLFPLSKITKEKMIFSFSSRFLSKLDGVTCISSKTQIDITPDGAPTLLSVSPLFDNHQWSLCASPPHLISFPRPAA